MAHLIRRIRPSWAEVWGMAATQDSHYEDLSIGLSMRTNPRFMREMPGQGIQTRRGVRGH